MHFKFQTPATDALIAIGPGAEQEPIQLTQNADTDIRLVGIRILSDVGTTSGLVVLEEIANGNEGSLERDAAEAAMLAIRARLGEP